MIPSSGGGLSAFEAKIQSEVGYKEGSNNNTKFGAWYGLNYEPWCAMFLSWCAAVVGLTPLVGRFASVFAWRSWAQSKGIWHAGHAGIRRGDIVIYTFSHVEYVRGASSNYIYTTGGNTSSGQAGSQRNGDGVYERVRARNSLISGYIRPHYPAPPAAKPVPSGKQSAAVRAKVVRWQRLLEITADGQWGDNTDTWSLRLRTASYWHTGGGPKKKFREDLVQKVIDTTPDNVWGPKSQAALERWVKQAQAVLGVTADGAWGKKTDAAFLALRKAAHNRF